MQMANELQTIMQEDANSLEHYGTKGMHWHQRRYQNEDGSYTELGKARRRVGYKDGPSNDEDSETKIGKAYKDMSKKELRAAKKKARHNEKERRAQREFNRDKRQAIEDGDYAFISKNISRFSNTEIDEAMQRIRKMNEFKDMAAKNEKSADHYIDKAVNFLQKASKATESVTNIYNKINESQQKSIAKQKALVELEKAKHPEKYYASKKEADEAAEKERKRLEEESEKARQKKEDRKAAEKKEEEEAEQKRKDEEQKRKDEADKKEQERKEAEDNRIAEITRKEKERIEAENKRLEDAKLQAEEEARAYRELANKRAAEEKEKREAYQRRLEYEAKLKEEEEKEKKAKTYQDSTKDTTNRNWWESYFGSDKIGGLFSKKDKYNSKSDNWKKDFEKTSKETEDLTKKYLDQLKDYNKGFFKIGSSSNSKLPRYASQDEKWKKDMTKHDSNVIDKWVKDMKKKYMTERNMSSKAAEKKAEEYVDAWLEAYDEGNI